MRESKICPDCGRSNLFSTNVSSGGGYAPNYLPGLGSFLRGTKFQVIVCQDCGLTRFFAPPEATAKLKDSSRWKRVL